MTAKDGNLPVATTENREGAGRFLIVCEHASNHFPDAFGTLGLGAEARSAHIAWDPGALAVARGLSKALDAPLVAAGISRLVYDLNRPPHSPGAMAAKSEVFDIPGNAALDPEERARRTRLVYQPFHAAVQAEIARRLAQGRPPILVTVHSFTPVYFGKRREVELGLIHDVDAAFAKAVLTEAQARTDLIARLNDPYSAADGVTHTLRLHATPYGLAHVMLEVRNDLLTREADCAAMALRIAPLLDAALAAIAPDEQQKAAS